MLGDRFPFPLASDIAFSLVVLGLGHICQWKAVAAPGPSLGPWSGGCLCFPGCFLSGSIGHRFSFLAFSSRIHHRCLLRRHLVPQQSSLILPKLDTGTTMVKESRLSLA